MEDKMIFESHAHYDDKAFDEDREKLIASLQKNNIEYVINVGADLKSTKNSIQLSQKYPFIYAAAGVHPSEVGELNEENFSWLRAQTAEQKVVAVGEIGLDYYWEKESDAQKNQRVWFERQIELAKEVKLPLIIHSREAAKDTFDIMSRMDAGSAGGVIHCYSYSKEMALDYINMGFFIGIGGVVTYKNARKTKETVEAIPIEKILLETDSPYLTPVPNRGKRNSSLNIPYIAQQIADIKGISYDGVVEITNNNAKKLFLK